MALLSGQHRSSSESERWFCENSLGQHARRLVFNHFDLLMYNHHGAECAGKRRADGNVRGGPPPSGSGSVARGSQVLTVQVYSPGGGREPAADLRGACGYLDWLSTFLIGEMAPNNPDSGASWGRRGELWQPQAHFSTGDKCGAGAAVPAWVARGAHCPSRAPAVLWLTAFMCPSCSFRSVAEPPPQALHTEQAFQRQRVLDGNLSFP